MIMCLISPISPISLICPYHAIAPNKPKKPPIGALRTIQQPVLGLKLKPYFLTVLWTGSLSL
jgi:hypothetical protein